jgi:hypothetical protein
MKKLLTNYLFKWLFYNSLNLKDGAIVECQSDLFKFDSSGGNPNSLKIFFKINGFWNYIKAKQNSIYNIDSGKFLNHNDINSQGYKGLEFYKNNIREANQEEINIYNTAAKCQK